MPFLPTPPPPALTHLSLKNAMPVKHVYAQSTLIFSPTVPVPRLPSVAVFPLKTCHD